MKVLIVDDSAVIRRVLSDIISSDPSLEVVDTARDGEEGLAKALKLRPDVITLDIEMPKMDGLTALKRIRRECIAPKPAVLMCSSLTREGSHQALKAMCLGAADFITKDSAMSLDKDKLHKEIIEKIKAIGMGKRRGARGHSTAQTNAAEDDKLTALASPPALRGEDFSAILIGSSTGGPPVLETIFKGLPASLHIPVIVAQHMPGTFTLSMAQRLDAMSPLTVVHGENGMPLHPGVGYVIPGGQHGRIRGIPGTRLRLDVSDDPADAPYKPSVNVLLESGAKSLGRRCLGVVLTGMGDDGMLGAKALHARGGVILGQDRASSVVWGMPKAVVDANVAKASLPPGVITKLLAGLAPTSCLRTPAA